MGDFSNSISNECSGCITAVWLQPCGVFAANVTEHSRGEKCCAASFLRLQEAV